MANKLQDVEKMKGLIAGMEDGLAKQEMLRLAERLKPVKKGTKYPDENYNLTVYKQEWDYIKMYKARKDGNGNYLRVDIDRGGKRSEKYIHNPTESKEEAIQHLTSYIEKDIQEKKDAIERLKKKLETPRFVGVDGRKFLDANGNEIKEGN